jgi:ribosomal protein S18 acetylase RimI-like enzyme
MPARHPLVRHAVLAELDQLEATLADAFADDPMMAWMYPDPATRPAHAAAFMRAGLEIGFPHGHVYAADRDAGVAVWSPPDVDLFDEAGVTRLVALLEAQLGPRAEEVGTGLLEISAHHPHDEPHFYLFSLGTRRERQSAGVGGHLLAEVLDRCDRQGFGAYLESSNGRNVPFYERHGFRVIAEVPITPDFCARPMWRDPQS